MKTTYLKRGALAALTLVIAGCVPRTTPPPRPAPTPSPTAIAPAPLSAPAQTPWLDMPATPGDWRYQAVPTGGVASFGAATGSPLLVMRCDRTQRQVFVDRTGQAAAQVRVTLRAETMERTVPGQPVAGPEPSTRVSLGVHDRLLDAMALSKGRFAVEVAGLPTLYVPAWPEVTRVIEDCRT